MTKKSILIIGSGGREHALGWKLEKSPKVGKIYFAPGTAGTAQIGENTNINALDFKSLIKFAKSNDIYLTVAGPDDILAAGIVDEFQKAGLRIFGPAKDAAQIESSKAFAKQLMKDEGIPTAQFQKFTDTAKAKTYLKKQNFPIVIKASGLALGKGVIIAQTLDEAQKTIEDMMVKKIFGDSGNEVVIEEFLEGREISIHAFSDGATVALFPVSRDHKQIFDGNLGPNTGGMGTLAPVPGFDKSFLEEIKQTIVLPTIKGMQKKGITFTGCLYPGLILTKQGPKVLEFNSRFGDPEMESYMRILDTDIFDILEACVDGTLSKLNIKWSDQSACCIVLASAGYPGASCKGDIIEGFEKIQKSTVGRSASGGDIVIFHFATKEINGKITTNGGRVLGITATGKNLDEALKKAYSAIGPKGIHFKGMQFRKDIGKTSNKIKAVIFDMDGLMIDSEPIQSQAFESVIREYGKKPQLYKSGIIQTPGLREKENWENIMEKHGFEEDVEILTEKRRNKYTELLKKNAIMQPGLKKLLILLKLNNIKMAIASSSAIEHISLALHVLQLTNYFSVVVSGKSVPRGKPYPDTFLEAAKQLKIVPEYCLVLEDAESGVSAGKAAGMKVIGVPNRFTKDQDFSKADLVVNSLSNITNTVLDSF